MHKRKLITLQLLLLASIILQTDTAYPLEKSSKQISLEIMTALSNDIAELIITKKEGNDPRRTKDHCINIVKHMTEIIAAIITTIQDRKQTRSMGLCDPPNNDLTVEHIVNQILQRIDAFELENNHKTPI